MMMWNSDFKYPDLGTIKKVVGSYNFVFSVGLVLRCCGFRR